jgi:hypothetical protein
VAEAVRFFSSTAVTASVPTTFHFLNAVGSITIARDPKDSCSDEALAEVTNTILAEPNGRSLLFQHLKSAVDDIVKSADSLQKMNKIASLVIMTDSDASDGDAAEILRALEGFPVVVTVGLLAGGDDYAVYTYWHGVSARVDVEVHIVEDWETSAYASNNANDWLTYGLPVHRLRQHGTLMRELYAVDQCRMTRVQIRNICALV